MSVRPDIVDVWVVRGGILDGNPEATRRPPEILLLRRGPGRTLAGLWQGVSGSVEPDERVTAAALRELAEETGFGADDVRVLYDLDLVNAFHWPSADAVVLAAVFAVVVGPDAEPAPSDEHDAARWAPLDEALRIVVWPGYRTALERIRDDLLDPDRAPWFELSRDGLDRRIR